MTQEDYIQILFNDVGMTRQQRNAYLTEEVGRDIHYLDALTKKEKSQIIDNLKEMKGDIER